MFICRYMKPLFSMCIFSVEDLFCLLWIELDFTVVFSQAISQHQNTWRCSTRSRQHPCLSAQLPAAEGCCCQGQEVASWSWSAPGTVTFICWMLVWRWRNLDNKPLHLCMLAARGAYSCAGQSLWADTASRGHPSETWPIESTGGTGQRCSGLEGERSKDIPTEKLPFFSPWGKRRNHLLCSFQSSFLNGRINN